MKKLTITNNNGYYTTKKTDNDYNITCGGSDTLRKELFNNILSENVTTWKHDIHRLHNDHKEDIYKTFDEFVMQCQKHMEYLFDNYYKKKDKRCQNIK